MNKCPKCGSRNTWDDMTMWGCSDCGWMGSNMPIGLVPHPEDPRLKQDNKDENP